VYLWAGHLEWTHWEYGTPIPNFAAYFSGAPVLYPPLAAMADSVAGLAGPRILSLLFMLGATALLYTTTNRIFGQSPGGVVRLCVVRRCWADGRPRSVRHLRRHGDLPAGAGDKTCHLVRRPCG